MMINYIIYEDNKNDINGYVKIINKFMLNRNVEYKIITFDKYADKINKVINEKIDGKKVYILDVEVFGMSGIDLARLIRSCGDWNSQIILVTAYAKKDYYYLTNRLLMLDFIDKYNLENELLLTLNTVWKIFFRDKLLSFKYNSEIFNIFYNDIYYIEKNINNNTSTIVTNSDKYIIRSSISDIIRILNNDSRFFKSHRSCIVNLDNICKFDIRSNVIYFKNRKINLIARDKKKSLKDLLLEKRH